MADNDNGGFAWFLAGLGIGALAGVLYAPKSGKETRDDLKASAFDAKDRAAQLYSETADQVNDYVRQGKDVANDYVDKGRSQFNEYVDKGKDLIQNQADAAKAAVEAGKSAYVEKTTTNDPLV